MKDKNNHSIRSAEKITLTLPNEFLAENNFCIIDTPGIEDPNNDIVQLTFEVIPSADALCLLFDANYAESKREFEFLRGLLKNDREKKIFIVLNKIDGKNKKDVDVLVAKLQAEMIKMGIGAPRIYPLSAEKALQAEIQKSVIPEDFKKFKDELISFLKSGTGEEIQRAAKARLDNIASQLQNACRNLSEIEEKPESERANLFGKIKQGKRQALEIVSKQNEEMEKKIEAYRNTFHANFENFCHDLRRDLLIKIDASDLKTLKQTNILEIHIKDRTKEFVEIELQKVHAQIQTDMSLALANLKAEFQKIQFPIEISIPDYTKYSKFVLPAAIIIGFTTLGLFTFVYFLVGVLIGRTFLEESIDKVLTSFGVSGAREKLKSLITEQIEQFKKRYLVKIDEHFDDIKRQVCGTISKSGAEMLGEVSIISKTPEREIKNKLEIIRQNNAKLAEIRAKIQG